MPAPVERRALAVLRDRHPIATETTANAAPEDVGRGLHGLTEASMRGAPDLFGDESFVVALVPHAIEDHFAKVHTGGKDGAHR